MTARPVYQPERQPCPLGGAGTSAGPGPGRTQRLFRARLLCQRIDPRANAPNAASLPDPRFIASTVYAVRPRALLLDGTLLARPTKDRLLTTTRGGRQYTGTQ